MNILFVAPYPRGEAPSQRFRFEQYLAILEEEGHTYTHAPFLDLPTWKILYKEGHPLKKMLGILKGFARRLWLLTSLHRYDWVFIHREATPIGPPLFEWLITKVFRKRVVFDFDDAIWLPNTSEQNSLAASLKWHHKTAAICRWSYRISAGNDYLVNWARQYNPEVVKNPTTIDTLHLHNQLKQTQDQIITIGWTGTHSTLKYLKPLEGLLRQLAENYPQLRFLVISNQAPDLKIPRLVFKPWSRATEAADLLLMDIGIMPLTPDPWSEGKCGFKALQYMALGIAPVVSPVGVNTSIVQHDSNGMLAASEAEWRDCILRLIHDPALRQAMGKRARTTVEALFSVSSNRANFLRLFT